MSLVFLFTLFNNTIRRTKVPYIPEAVSATAIIETLEAAGLEHLNSGKTGELFQLADSEYLLMVKTDRISIFDSVLRDTIPNKGRVLTAMTVAWLNRVLPTDSMCGDHLVAFGYEIDEYLPPALHKNRDLQSRALVVRKKKMPDIECIVRGYLTGSSLKPYQKSGVVCGHQLPQGLQDGDQLPKPIFTPSTKAAVGHDEHIDYLSVRKSHGTAFEEFSLELYRVANEYAQKRGIIIADTKFEFSPDGMLIDEVFTPDSSRFWGKTEWNARQKKQERVAPPGMDKQHIRNWGKKVATPFIDPNGKPIVGIDKLDPTNKEHVAFVSTLTVDPAVIQETARLYDYCLFKLFDVHVEDFWKTAIS